MTMPFIDSNVTDWINTRSLLLAKSINQTTLKALREILKDSYEKGDSIATITSRIRDYFPTNEKYRAEAVSRTEVLQANNSGTIARYKDEGITQFQWDASPDACEECQPLDGKEFDIDAEHPPLHVNCRCSVQAIIRS